MRLASFLILVACGGSVSENGTATIRIKMQADSATTSTLVATFALVSTYDT